MPQEGRAQSPSPADRRPVAARITTWRRLSIAGRSVLRVEFGGTFGVRAYQPRRIRRRFWLLPNTNSGATQEIRSWTAHGTLAGSVKPAIPADGGFAPGVVLEKRKPLLLLRLSGELLLRFADRRLSGLLLLNEPPRNTRLVDRIPAGEFTAQESPQQVTA